MEITTDHVWTLLREDLAGFFRGRVRDEHLAEDLVQETLVRVHDRLADLRQADRLAAWVWSVARNVLTDHRRRSALPPERASASGKPGELDTLPAALEPGPDHTDRAGTWAKLMIVLLPEPYREALELSELQGLSQPQIAERLALSLPGAKSRIQRGRAKLRDLLLACCHIEFDDHGVVVDYTRRGQCCGGADA